MRGIVPVNVFGGVLNDHLVWDVFQVYPHLLLVLHWFIKVIVDDFRRQVAGPFSVVGDDRVDVDLEVEKADFWGSGVAVVGEFFRHQLTGKRGVFQYWRA